MSECKPATKEEVARCIAARKGSVLGRGSILKYDFYPHSSESLEKDEEKGRAEAALLCHYDYAGEGTVKEDGTLNFRQVPGVPVHAVGQGTVEGIRRVLRTLGAAPGDGKGHTVHWACMREEPVVYIAGKPFTIRDVSAPFTNVTFTGISGSRLEAMESQFKADIEKESQQYGGKILVHQESAGGVECDWVTIFEDGSETSSVRTLREVYENLKEEEHFRVRYLRIPVSGQQAPQPHGFDAFVKMFASAAEQSEFVFNCQSGRGRSTTGLVVGTLLYFYLYARESSLEHGTFISEGNTREEIFPPPRVQTPDLRVNSNPRLLADRQQQENQTGGDTEEERLERGELPAILDLVRLLDGGNRSKFIADQLIDLADMCINLRTTILTQRKAAMKELPSTPVQSHFLESLRESESLRQLSLPNLTAEAQTKEHRFEKCLSRYFYIIVFADYVRSLFPFSHEYPEPKAENPRRQAFSDWLGDRPEIVRITDTFQAELLAKPEPDSKDACTRVVLARSGSVLCRGTLLKSDHFPGCHMEHMKPKIEGAPNYRTVEGFPVHGVGQPTVAGLRTILRNIAADCQVAVDGEKKAPKVLWMNMREEPVLYINDRPFVLRNMDKPFNNVEYTGISSERIERVEARLKEEVLRESMAHGQRILLHDETPAGVETVWEDVDRRTVFTLKEAFEKLATEEGFDVTYRRIPITDEKTPEAKDFDEIVASVKEQTAPGVNLQLVYNCQMGRGRTTTSMIVGCLLCTWLMWEHLYVPLKDDSPADYLSEEDTLTQGHYYIVNDLRRLLHCGPTSKQQLDGVIDLCTAVQNLRTAIYPYLTMYRNPPKESKKQFAAERFTNYLERYINLVLFAEYVNRESANAFCTTFDRWLASHPEFGSVIERFLHEEKERPWLPGLPEEVDGSVRHCGAVLTARSLLKNDKIKSDKEPQGRNCAELGFVFRRAEGFPVYGMAQPSISAIREVLERIGAKQGSGGKSVQWINLREEPVVYINGTSYVLRGADKPFQNVSYKGISSESVRLLSQRLRTDVVREATANGGKILLYSEKGRKLVPRWEEVGVGSVQTLEEVFETLEADGYRVAHHFIPLSANGAPTAAAVTSLFHCIEQAPKNAQFIFNDMRGRGRTTIGMVLAVLLLHCRRGLPLRLPENVKPSGFSSTFATVRSLLRTLNNGAEVSDLTDRTLLLCSPVFTKKIVSELTAAKDEAMQVKRDKANHRLMQRGVGRLRQYLMLLVAAEFLMSPVQADDQAALETFAARYAARPELATIVYSNTQDFHESP